MWNRVVCMKMEIVSDVCSQAPWDITAMMVSRSTSCMYLGPYRGFSADATIAANWERKNKRALQLQVEEITFPNLKSIVVMEKEDDLEGCLQETNLRVLKVWHRHAFKAPNVQEI